MLGMNGWPGRERVRCLRSDSTQVSELSTGTIHILSFLDGFFSGNKHKGLKHMVFTQGMFRYRCTHPYSFVVFCLKIHLWRKHHFKRLNFCDSHLCGTEVLRLQSVKESDEDRRGRGGVLVIYKKSMVWCENGTWDRCGIYDYIWYV